MTDELKDGRQYPFSCKPKYIDSKDPEIEFASLKLMAAYDNINRTLDI